ncbi:hypothetical protein D5018_08565 [Parashewanella curva]|uniref:Uncharacterized protein n=1 Tax=Parashewanella curva TaxID=2338552 RepID=A0A3L8PXI5_9GAMM|nr:hypothetical protein [Parashewanella curva]RLV60177.1 hypothetical protein D5018_08565 [Parashewanella curva]
MENLSYKSGDSRRLSSEQMITIPVPEGKISSLNEADCDDFLSANTDKLIVTLSSGKKIDFKIRIETESNDITCFFKDTKFNVQFYVLTENELLESYENIPVPLLKKIKKGLSDKFTYELNKGTELRLKIWRMNHCVLTRHKSYEVPNLISRNRRVLIKVVTPVAALTCLIWIVPAVIILGVKICVDSGMPRDECVYS